LERLFEIVFLESILRFFELHFPLTDPFLCTDPFPLADPFLCADPFPVADFFTRPDVRGPVARPRNGDGSCATVGPTRRRRGSS